MSSAIKPAVYIFLILCLLVGCASTKPSDESSLPEPEEYPPFNPLYDNVTPLTQLPITELDLTDPQVQSLVQFPGVRVAQQPDMNDESEWVFLDEIQERFPKMCLRELNERYASVFEKDQYCYGVVRAHSNTGQDLYLFMLFCRYIDANDRWSNRYRFSEGMLIHHLIEIEGTNEKNYESEFFPLLARDNATVEDVKRIDPATIVYEFDRISGDDTDATSLHWSASTAPVIIQIAYRRTESGLVVSAIEYHALQSSLPDQLQPQDLKLISS